MAYDNDKDSVFKRQPAIAVPSGVRNNFRKSIVFAPAAFPNLYAVKGTLAETLSPKNYATNNEIYRSGEAYFQAFVNSTDPTPKHLTLLKSNIDIIHQKLKADFTDEFLLDEDAILMPSGDAFGGQGTGGIGDGFLSADEGLSNGSKSRGNIKGKGIGTGNNLNSYIHYYPYDGKTIQIEYITHYKTADSKYSKYSDYYQEQQPSRQSQGFRPAPPTTTAQPPYQGGFFIGTTSSTAVSPYNQGVNNQFRSPYQ